jgi:hypothetical protein
MDINKGLIEKEYLLDNFEQSTCAVSVDDLDLAEFIRTNESLIKNDDQFRLCVFKKIMNQSTLLKEIFTYEFLNYTPKEQTNDMVKLFNIMINDMHKYQGVVGGFNIEDQQWIICDGTTRFKPKDNQKAIYNSIQQFDCSDKSLKWYLKYFTRHIKKFIDPSSNIIVNYKVFDDDHNEMCWIVFILEKK